MADENNYTAPVLDDIDYTAPAQKNSGLAGVSAPVLDDIEYADASPRKGAPTGVAAPVLDDMDQYYDTSQKKGAPTGVSAPVLDDMDTYDPSQSQKKGDPSGVSAPVLSDTVQPSAPEKLIMTDEEIIAGFTDEQKTMYDGLPEEKKQMVLDMRRKQLGAEAPPPVIQAPVLDEDNYVPPPKKETPPPEPAEPITAPVLDDEPEVPKYVPKYVDEDIEKAKLEGAKKALSSQLTSNQKDSKESLRMMLELKEQQRQELAKKGGKIAAVLVLVGILAAVAFYLLYSGKLGLTYKDSLSGAGKIIQESALYISVITGVISFTLLTGIAGFKSLNSFVYFVFSFVQLFPGLFMIPQHNGKVWLIGLLYAVGLIGGIAVFVTLSASEAVGLYFKKPAKQREDL